MYFYENSTNKNTIWWGWNYFVHNDFVQLIGVKLWKIRPYVIISSLLYLLPSLQTTTNYLSYYWFRLIRNFHCFTDPNMDSNQRLAILNQNMADLRKTYANLKAELSVIDRRRKKLKRKEREGKYIKILGNMTYDFGLSKWTCCICSRIKH